MGLDSVELVMAWEEEFGINIGDDEAAKVFTVGEAIDLIHEKLSRGLSNSPADTVIGRISEVTGESEDQLRKESPLRSVFPAESRVEMWSELVKTLGYSVIGELRRPRWVVIAGWVFALAAAFGLCPRFGGWALWAAPLVGVLWIAMTRPLKRCFPLGMRVVGDLTTKVEKQQEIYRQKQYLSRDAVRQEVVQITVEQLGVKPEQCTDDAKFIEDLGCD